MVTAMRRHQRAGQPGDLRDRLCTTTVNVLFKVLLYASTPCREHLDGTCIFSTHHR